MSLLWILIIGLLVGAVTRLIFPKIAPGDLVITMLLGMVGALATGCIGRAAGLYEETGPLGIIGSVMGAALILPLSHQFKGPRTDP
ncbi:MAG: hypothetical protein JWO89_1065 [Verrucomicrobiaceae bacterium]|nr:hypothetical protein [Verrucomicrobiaceae bacterium]MDB6119837.1 hypothetical protein [Verrucomicrobiaceae bacterium]